ncbi:MAG: hypothetical protein LLG09_04775 [Negativicutes bacterium]|nr:hypothetical protein [Negativicutes bacterium]
MVATENNRQRAVYCSLPEEYHLAILVGRENRLYFAHYSFLPSAFHPAHFSIAFSYYSFLFFFCGKIRLSAPASLGLAA